VATRRGQRAAILEREAVDARARRGRDQRIGERLDPQPRERAARALEGRAAHVDDVGRRVEQDRPRLAVVAQHLVGEDAASARHGTRVERGVPGRRVGHGVVVAQLVDGQALAPQACEAARLGQRGPAALGEPRRQLIDDDRDEQPRRGLSGRAWIPRAGRRVACGERHRHHPDEPRAAPARKARPGSSGGGRHLARHLNGGRSTSADSEAQPGILHTPGAYLVLQ
jgi:hypothetical protein